MQEITLLERHPAPAVTPQALAWDGEQLWLSSRDLGTLYRVDPQSWEAVEQVKPPGVIWAAVQTNDGWRFTIGEGAEDDRYVYRYTAGDGFQKLFACPEFAGSYLSFDGQNLYLSQWYKGHILKLNDEGRQLGVIKVGPEICGHTFADGMLYVLRGRENKDAPENGEEWRLARLDPRQEEPEVEDLATIPFAARSLAYDGERFWSNHRAANETIAFRPS